MNIEGVPWTLGSALMVSKGVPEVSKRSQLSLQEANWCLRTLSQSYSDRIPGI